MTKEYLDEKTNTILRAVDEKIDTVLRTVKIGFDAVDERFNAVDKRFDSVDERFTAVDRHFQIIEGDLDHIKERLRLMENEVRALAASMVTKQYLDAKMDALLMVQQKDSLFKKTLLLALEQAKVLPPETRAKLELMIS